MLRLEMRATWQVSLSLASEVCFYMILDSLGCSSFFILSAFGIRIAHSACVVTKADVALVHDGQL